jgi:hypothetical protein
MKNPRARDMLDSPLRGDRPAESTVRTSGDAMKTKKFLAGLLCAFALVLILSSCLPGDGKNSIEKPAGFWSGIWHGWIAPLSLVVGIFDRNIRIYEKANSGWWYDLGFYMAVISGFGGLALSRKAKNRKRQA